MRAVSAHADHLESLAMIASVESVQSRHFLAARRTPGCPEVDDYDFPALRTQIECLTVQFGHVQRRRGVADSCGGERQCGHANERGNSRTSEPQCRSHDCFPSLQKLELTISLVAKAAVS